MEYIDKDEVLKVLKNIKSDIYYSAYETDEEIVEAQQDLLERIKEEIEEIPAKSDTHTCILTCEVGHCFDESYDCCDSLTTFVTAECSCCGRTKTIFKNYYNENDTDYVDKEDMGEGVFHYNWDIEKCERETYNKFVQEHRNEITHCPVCNAEVNKIIMKLK